MEKTLQERFVSGPVERTDLEGLTSANPGFRFVWEFSDHGWSKNSINDETVGVWILYLSYPFHQPDSMIFNRKIVVGSVFPTSENDKFVGWKALKSHDGLANKDKLVGIYPTAKDAQQKLPLAIIADLLDSAMKLD